MSIICSAYGVSEEIAPGNRRCGDSLFPKLVTVCPLGSQILQQRVGKMKPLGKICMPGFHRHVEFRLRDILLGKVKTMMKRKTLCVVAMLTVFAGPTLAGGMAEPLMEPEVLVEETAAGSGGIVIPLLLLAIIAAVASSDSAPTF